MVTRVEALDKLQSLISNKNLVKHCLAVEAAMTGYADYFKVAEKEKEKWAIAGLLHDADWEKYPDKHPLVIVEWLKKANAGEDIINAIEAHGFDFGIPAKTLMAKTLRAVDELTGLIVAVTLVRESRKLSDVSLDSVLKKWKVPSFAKGVKREDIEKGAAEIGVPLNKHIEIVLSSMQKIAGELGL